MEIVVVSKAGKDMGALQEGGVIEAKKVVGPNSVNDKVVLTVKHHVVLANLESSDLGMLLTMPVVTPHFVQQPDEEDRSVEDPGVGVRVPSDNVDEVKDSDKLMDFDSNVPPGGQPIHAQRSQDGKEDGHFYHTIDIVDLQAYHFGLCVGILEAWWSALREWPLKGTNNDLSAPVVCDTRQQDAPHVQKCQDYQGNGVPPMKPRIGVDNVAAIQDMLANKGCDHPMLKRTKPHNEKQIEAANGEATGNP
jgi:hypothetical protein